MGTLGKEGRIVSDLAKAIAAVAEQMAVHNRLAFFKEFGTMYSLEERTEIAKWFGIRAATDHTNGDRDA
jgi:hypothetical protein